MLERIHKLATLALAGPHTRLFPAYFLFLAPTLFLHRHLIIPVYLLAAEQADKTPNKKGGTSSAGSANTLEE